MGNVTKLDHYNYSFVEYVQFKAMLESWDNSIFKQFINKTNNQYLIQHFMIV